MDSYTVTDQGNAFISKINNSRIMVGSNSQALIMGINGMPPGGAIRYGDHMEELPLPTGTILSTALSINNKTPEKIVGLVNDIPVPFSDRAALWLEGAYIDLHSFCTLAQLLKPSILTTTDSLSEQRTIGRSASILLRSKLNAPAR